YTFPSTSPNDHFIFDITDGWYRLNQLTWGFRNTFYTKAKEGCISQKLYADLYTIVFFDTETIPGRFHKIYGQMIYEMTPRLRHTLFSAWDTQRGMLDHLNYLMEWTISNNAAFSLEYR